MLDLQTMLRTAVVLLALTAAGGLLAAAIRFSGRPHPPAIVTMLHGLLGAAGLTLLVYAGATARLPSAAWAGLGVLAAAVAGGLVLNLGYHWKQQALPVWLVLVHGAAAALGLVVVTLSVWTLPA
jgi:hypothetical protein